MEKTIKRIQKIAYFASGSGTNVENIVSYLQSKNITTESLILCNKPTAVVFERAEKLGIESFLFDAVSLDSGNVLQKLKKFQPDLIILAGFVLLIPDNIIQEFPNRIINIHPALLPNYGGKGMYGKRVHEAVLANNEKQSGITIHYIDENYDKGKYILKASCPVIDGETIESLSEKIHLLEYEHYPKIVEHLLNKNILNGINQEI